MTVSDAAGNTDNCVAVVTVADTTSPVASCQNVTLYVDGTGNASMNASDIDNGSNDNCGSVTLSASKTAFTCADLGANSITLTVTDGSGNSSNCVSTVTVVDTASPSASCQNITAYLDGTGNVTITGADLDNGSSDNCSSLTYAASKTAFTCSDAGANSVTLTVTDGSGNTANCVSTVTILDTVSPSAVCQNITVYVDGTGNATITAGDIDNGSSDNCGAVTLAASKTAFTCADAGANNVTLTVTDGAGNTANCVSTVTILDTVSPTAVCQNITAYLDGTGNVSITAGDIDNGSSDNCGAVTLVASKTAFTCTDAGANSITLTVTDGSGNTANCVSTVTVLDTVSPSAVCQNISVYVDGTGNATITAADIDNGSSDNCASVTLAASKTAFDCGDLGANNVTLTVTDGAGNTDNCSAVVTLLDTVSPTITCPGTQTASTNASCQFTCIDYTGLATTADNCTANPTVTQSPAVGATLSAGANTITLTSTDASGNTAQCSFTVNVEDNTNPTAVCQNITTYLDGTGSSTITAADLDNGSSDNCGAVTFSASQTSFTCANLGANNITLTVTDGNSNTDNCISVVTVLDTVSPTASCQNITAYLDGTGNVSITAADIDNGSTDNCSTITLAASKTAFSCSDAGANNVTLTVTDGSGNTSNCSAVVTILDTVSPSATCQNITAYLDGTGNVLITASDIDNGSTDNCGAVTLAASQTSFTCANTGANNVTLTVTDGSGNTDNCVAVVTVLDTISPTATCQNITAYLDGAGSATITAGDIDNGSSDNCGAVTLTASQTSFSCSNTGANNVTLTVTDASGNTDNCVAVVTILDTISPTVTCPGNQTENPDASCNFTLVDYTGLGAAADNCSATITQSPAAGTVITGTTTITLTATDPSGNTNNCTFDVILSDATAPTAVCQNINVYLDGAGAATINAADLDGGSTDNCSTLTFGASQTAFDCTHLGANNVTLTVTDGNSNTDNCVSVVTVLDTVSPTAVCQDITVYVDGAGNATIAAADIDNGSTDNCTSVTLAASQTAFTCANAGANNVTLTVTDGSGNTSNCVATVTVLDTVSPTPSCQNISVYLDGAGAATITAADIDNGSTDNCGSVSLAASQTSFSCANTGTNNVTLVVTDGSGNVDSCSAAVTVLDTVAPSPVCQNISVYLDGAGNATITAADIDNGSTDNCGAVTLTASKTAFDCADAGANTVTLVVTDAYANVDSCTAVVTAIDTVSPSPVCQDITVYLDGAGAATITAADIDNGSNDNCGAVTLAASKTTFSCSDAGANTVTLIVTDAHSNVDSCTATVTIMDTVSPSPVCQDITVYLDGAGAATITAADIDNGSNDNCGAVTLAASKTTFSCIDAGANNVTLVVTDGSGNVDSCTAVVTVMDTIAPAPVCQNINVYLDGAGAATITAADIDNGSSDNCGAVTLSASKTTFSCAEIGANNVTLVVTDGSGNVDSCSAVVTIMDTISPVVTCPGNQTETPNASCEFVMVDYTGLASATDNCSGAPVITQSPVAGVTINGTTTVWMYANDGNGNVDSCSFDVILSDAIPPTVVCQNITTYLDATGNIAINAQDLDGGSTDNCSGLNFTASQTAFTCADLGTVNVTLYVTDGNGNIDSCTSVVTVMDTIAPVPDVAMLADVTAECTATVTAPTAMDTCSGAITATTTDPTTYSTEGTYVITWTYTDASGNSSTQTQNVIIDDVTAPVVTCPGDQTETPNASCEFTIVDYTGLAAATDNCVASPTLTQSPAVGTTVNGNTVVWIYANDGNGNVDSCSFNVILVDAVAPIAVCQDITTYLDSTGNVAINAQDLDGGSTDNCSGLNFTASQTAFTCADLGTVDVTLYVTDGNGNIDSCTSVVTVMDTIAPVPDVAMLADVTAECTVTVTAPSAMDTCSGAVTATTTDPTTYSTEGTYVITWTYTDASGNSSTQTQNVIIDDVTAPVVTCPGDQTETPNASCEFTIVDYTGLAAATDNCVASPTLTQSPAVGTTVNGNTVVWIYANDGNGNVDSCSFNVILVDAVAPIAVCQDITTYLDSTGNVAINAQDLDGGSTDNCSGLNFTASQTAFTCADLGTVNVTLYVTDGNGNIDSCTSVVTVMDTIAPVPDVAMLADVTAECTATVTAPSAMDTCSGAITATTTDPTTYSTEGTYVITWTYTDASGNSSIQTQNVIIDDTTAPVVACPGNQTETPNASCEFVLVDYTGLASATDNCVASPTLTQSPAVGATVFGNTTVWIYANDGNGNVDSCSFEVILTDAVAPTVVCQDITTYLDSAGNVTINAADLDGGSSDNCGGVHFTASQTAFSCGELGANNVMLYVTDDNGNIDSCTAVVTVMDTIAPLADVAILADATGECSASVTAPTATDACDGTITATTTDPLTYSTQGTYTVNWTYTDASGNTSTQTQMVVVNDTTAPVVTCPGDQNENPIANCEFVLPDYTGLASATDNCDGTTAVVQSPAAGTSIFGNTMVYMISTDAQGNSDSCSFTVILTDTENPVAVCQDITIYLDSMGTVSITGNDIDGGSTDNCTGMTLTPSQDTFTCADLGTNTVTLTAEDGSGNTATCNATVTVMDTLAPLADSADLTVFASCSVTITPPTATDNCAGTVTGTTTDPLSYTAQGIYSITWTYDDGNGNTTTQVQSVTIQDTIAPVVTCIGDQNETPIANCEFVLPDYTGSITSVDNCDGALSVTQSPAPGTSIFGNTTIYMSSVDAAGNADSCSFEVILLDVTAPTAVCQDATIYLDANGQVVLTPADIDGGSSDNCTGYTLSASMDTMTCADLGSHSVNLIIVDAAGLSDTCTATVEVVDTIAPVADIASLMDTTIICQLDTLVVPTATDNCGGLITATTNATFPITTSTNVVWTFLDGSGNVSSQTQSVTITPVDTSTTVSGFSITANMNGASYQWLDCDDAMSAIPGATGQVYTATVDGNYALEVTYGNCVDTSSCVAIIGTGVTDGEGLFVLIYPNPAEDVINIQTDGQIQEVVLYDMLGALVKVETNTTISLEGLARGVYVLDIRTNKGEVRKRFTKM